MSNSPYVAGQTSVLDPYVPSSKNGEDSLLKQDYYQIVDNALDLTRNSPIAKSIIQAMEDDICRAPAP